MKYLFKKELNSYFATPFGFIFIGIFLLLSGIMFTIYNLVGGSGSLGGMFELLKNFSFVVFPVLTMKAFAEERKSGTEQLLVTSTLSETDIVLGKFLAACCVFLIALAATLPYVVIIARFGSLNAGSTAASYLGFILLGISMTAVCMFASSLADNQVTAAIVSFGLLFVMVMLLSLSKSVSIPVITPLLSALAITRRYDEFTRGILRMGPICYYVGVTVIFVFLTVINLKRRRFI